MIPGPTRGGQICAAAPVTGRTPTVLVTAARPDTHAQPVGSGPGGPVATAYQPRLESFDYNQNIFSWCWETPVITTPGS